MARTRRSSAARSAPGSTSGRSPAGSNSGSRARVSASMPLDLACLDRNRRRSAAFCEDTRNTLCPHAVKNTATGSHAGPVGSITTSSLVPSGQSASAAVSTGCQALPRRPGLALGHDRSLAVEHPHRVRGGNPQVDADQPPVAHPASSRRMPDHTGSPRGGGAPSGHGPKRPRPAAAPTHVLQPGPASTGRPTSLIRGIRGQARGGNQNNEARPCGPASDPFSTPPPGPAGDDHATPWDSAPWWIHGRLVSLT